MCDLVIKFTEHSKDPSNYGKIHANLKTPFTQFSTLIIDSLTTTAAIEVLNKDDYIIVNDTRIQFEDSYSSLNAQTVSTLLNYILAKSELGIETYVDNTNRIVFTSENTFTINECSYNVAQVIGFFDQQLPLTATLQSDKHIVQALSVGNFLSTPILYLLASIGEKCFINEQKNKRILMRINNSYSANFPVISNNAEFSTYGLSNDFSDITFELVDANFKSIKLLSPMYLCGNLTADVKAETINTSILITPESIVQQQQQSNVNDTQKFT